MINVAAAIWLFCIVLVMATLSGITLREGHPIAMGFGLLVSLVSLVLGILLLIAV